MQIESQLIAKINQSFIHVDWARYQDLIAKRHTETLAPDEQVALIALSDQIEEANAKRIKYLAELADIRNMTLPVLMNELNLKPVSMAKVRMIRPAQTEDLEQITACVTAAYEHYIPRIGKPPGPMLDDYAEIVAQHSVWVAVAGDRVAGVVVLMEKADGILLDNIAVHPTYQGQGIGRRLMDVAEDAARRRGYAEIELYTHVKMAENVAIYEKMGYVETARRTVRGYARIYMRKRLKNSPLMNGQ